MKTLKIFVLFFSLILLAVSASGQKAGKIQTQDVAVTSEMLTSINFRSIGPATFSGRIIDLAVNPKNISEYYVATGSGGLWKTTNSGTTYTPVFDNQSAYSIGTLAIDPKNPEILWVGTGENNSQRALAAGDGVYKTTDGGKTFVNTGLKKSEHIGKIVIDPRNSDVVYVAAQGPVWGPGGERGLYKTTNGGKSWERILYIGEYTGISDLEMDPRNPDILYAVAHQRERRAYSKINGGPESGLHKSSDGGKTWKKLANGFPSEGNVGRIGIALSKPNPDILYAMIELPQANTNKGFYRSTDKGEKWEKMSTAGTSSPQYYQELLTDPIEENTVFYYDVSNMRSKDGGKTWSQIGERNKHVDNHTIWINPNNNKHYLAGCDGGLYESFDAGATWIFKQNLPLAQFYHVRVDNNFPFYRVYGGTQDNGSWFGPARTIRQSIVNDDWTYALGGDGFLSIPDPVDPTVSYHESQDGGIARYDHLLQRSTTIRPARDSVPYRFNWDTPYLISNFDHNTLYIGAQKVLKSTNNGDTWKGISQDLTRQIKTDTMPMMGKVWNKNEAVGLGSSTAPFGNIQTLAESPLKQGMIYAGTDDGVISLTEDDGANWTKYDNFPGVPVMTLVTSVLPSMHNVNTVYATFDGKKNSSDWTPYILKSTDKGKTWKSISSNLPLGTVYAVREDHVSPNLLFIGTEYGVYVTLDGGLKWFQLKTGLPTIQVCDLDIQRRDNDLVIATFGRGFYVVDDYSYLRELTRDNLRKPAHIFSPGDTWQFSMGSNISGQGESYFKTPNPPIAVAIKYYIKDLPQPVAAKKTTDTVQTKPVLVFTITNAADQVVNVTERPFEAGVHAFQWNMRVQIQQATPAAQRTPAGQAGQGGQGGRGGAGRTATSGTYFVKVEKKLNSQVELLAEPVPFTIRELDRELLRNPNSPVINYMK